MVEGHQCHRVAHAHRRLLVGRKFEASSPNGRFSEGAGAVSQKPLDRIEVHGKNLFYFFGKAHEPVVVHVHFGMSGAFRTSTLPGPEPTDTTRLRLVNHQMGLMAHLSAMVVQHGTLELYHEKTSKLGPDPLREDADKELLWVKMQKLKKPIGLVLMDQSCVAGIGNIYRAEILFKAGIHPELPCNAVTRNEFESIWFHSVTLLQRGFRCGSILTVEPEEAKILGKPWTRRYIYNQKTCGRCRSSIRTWDMSTRTVYACPTCQPLRQGAALAPSRQSALKAATNAQLFNSHCAPDDPEDLVPSRMTVSQLRELLLGFNLNTQGNKAVLIQRLEAAMQWAGKKDLNEGSAIISIPEDTHPRRSWRNKWKQTRVNSPAQATSVVQPDAATASKPSKCVARSDMNAAAGRASEIIVVAEETVAEIPVVGLPASQEDGVGPGVVGKAVGASAPESWPALAAEDGDVDSDCGLLGIPKHLVNQLMEPGSPHASGHAGLLASPFLAPQEHGLTAACMPIKPTGPAASSQAADKPTKTPAAPSRSRTAQRAAQSHVTTSNVPPKQAVPVRSKSQAAGWKSTRKPAGAKSRHRAALEEAADVTADTVVEQNDDNEHVAIYDVRPGTQGLGPIASAQVAALEKLLAGESRAVEHVALHDDDTDTLLAAVTHKECAALPTDKLPSQEADHTLAAGILDTLGMAGTAHEGRGESAGQLNQSDTSQLDPLHTSKILKEDTSKALEPGNLKPDAIVAVDDQLVLNPVIGAALLASTSKPRGPQSATVQGKDAGGHHVQSLEADGAGKKTVPSKRRQVVVGDDGKGAAADAGTAVPGGRPKRQRRQK